MTEPRQFPPRRSVHAPQHRQKGARGNGPNKVTPASAGSTPTSALDLPTSLPPPPPDQPNLQLPPPTPYDPYVPAKSRGKRIALTTTAVLVVLALGLATAVGIFIWRLGAAFDSNTATLDLAFPAEQSRPAPRDDSAQTLLLLGSDLRGDLDESVLTEAQDSRSDVIMVVRIPENRENIFVFSIMRDSWVEIPRHGYSKINAAMSYGGVPLTVETVESLIGSRIDHVAIIDFSGFEGLTDALGGVTVTNEHEFTSRTKKIHFPEGKIELDGRSALEFVRERYSFVDGDYQRVRNQQAYVKAVVKQIMSRDTLTNPATLSSVVAQISPYLQVDDEFDASYLSSIVPSLANLNASDIKFLSVPTAGIGTSPDGQSIIELDMVKMEQVREAFENDTLQDLQLD